MYFNSMRRCKVQKVGSKPEGVLEFRGAGVGCEVEEAVWNSGRAFRGGDLN